MVDHAPFYLITKARLPLTHSLTHSVVPYPKSKVYSAKKKGLAFISSQIFPDGRVVKAMDFRSNRDSTRRFNSVLRARMSAANVGANTNTNVEFYNHQDN